MSVYIRAKASNTDAGASGIAAQMAVGLAAMAAPAPSALRLRWRSRGGFQRFCPSALSEHMEGLERERGATAS